MRYTSSPRLGWSGLAWPGECNGGAADACVSRLYERSTLCLFNVCRNY